MGPRCRGYRAWGLWTVSKKKVQFFLGKCATVFQSEIYAILDCVPEIKTHEKPEKHVSIFCESQVALKSLKAKRTMSLLVYQCQKVLNDISTLHAV
jgi:hypothetical protein